MDDKTIIDLKNFRQYKTEVHKLSNSLCIPDKDAAEELLVELIGHRFNTWTDEKLQTALANNDINASYKITYARKELLRRHYKAINNKAKAVHELEANTDTSYEILTLDASERTRSDVDVAIGLIDRIFANKATCEWVKSVLTVGAKETQARYSQSHRSFSQKLNRVCRYAVEHRERTIGLMKSRDNEGELKELKQLTVFADLIASEDCTDGAVQAFINENTQLVNDLIDTPAIKYQGKLVKDFATADNADKYELVNLLAERKEKLSSYLVLQ